MRNFPVFCPMSDGAGWDKIILPAGAEGALPYFSEKLINVSGYFAPDTIWYGNNIGRLAVWSAPQVWSKPGRMMIHRASLGHKYACLVSCRDLKPRWYGRWYR